MSDTARARLEAEAAELYPVIAIDGVRQGDSLRSAYVRAKTVSAEQIEAAAMHCRHECSGRITGVDETMDDNWAATSERVREHWRNSFRAGLRAAGFLIEGAD